MSNKATLRVLSIASFMACLSTSCERQPSEPVMRDIEPGILRVLPQDLDSLQEETGYLGWEFLQMFSRTVGHYRQIRFHPESNVVISETGRQPGQVDVVEVIRISLETDWETDFALYHPGTGERLQQYPEEVGFEIEGIVDGSRTPVPSVCIACHHQPKSLNAVLAWSKRIEESIEYTRRSGIGIRQFTVDPLPEDESTRERIRQFNSLLRERFPDHFNDLRDRLVDVPEAPR